jgi:hypothetical protein
MNTYFFNFHRIFHLGDIIELRPKINCSKLLDDLEIYKDNWFQYNPRKKIKRYGLSIINDTGKLISGPDLDSLPQYNNDHGTTLSEIDFRQPTPVFDIDQVKNLLTPMKSFLLRTHFLKLPPGGYFPPHRDEALREESGRVLSFRILSPIYNTDFPNVQFMLDNNFVHFKQGSLYVVNTFKSHSLVNMSTDDSIWLIINAVVSDDGVDFVHSNMSVS